MSEPKRIALIACGILLVALAAVGIVIPVLPTTPLLLLAAACFARSSARFHHWLLTNRWFGSYIRNYREGRGITLPHKVLALTLLWATIGYAALFVVPHWSISLLLLGIAVGVSVHLLKARTYRPEPTARLRPEQPDPEEAL